MKADFSRLLRRVTAGEEVTINRAGTWVARLVPVEPLTLRVLASTPGHSPCPTTSTTPSQKKDRTCSAMSHGSSSATVRPNPRKPMRVRVPGIGVIAGPTLRAAVRDRSFDAGVENRPRFRYTVGNYSPPSEPSGPNWRGLSIPAHPQRLGIDAGMFTVPDDFNPPTTKDTLDMLGP